LLKLRNEGYRPNIIMRCDSPEAIKTAVSKSLGVGFLYKDAVREGLAIGVFKKLCIPDLPMYGNSYIIYHKQRPLSSSGRVFLNLLRQWRDEKATQKR
jgi:DNA-binding transcriptional LysR family regulator